MTVHQIDKANDLTEKLMKVCSEFSRREYQKKRDPTDTTGYVFVAISRFVPAMIHATIINPDSNVDRDELVKGRKALYEVLMANIKDNMILLDNNHA